MSDTYYSVGGNPDTDTLIFLDQERVLADILL
jgi:hypothetical protein